MSPVRRWMLLCLVLIANPLAGAERYTAQFQDGTRVEDAEIRHWHDAEANPTLGGKAVFDATNPARWILDRQQPPGPPAAAFVEFTGGDRLAGVVTGVRTGQEDPYDQRPPHLLVKPATDCHYPDDKSPSDIRVSTAWVQRIVWRRMGGDVHRPGTVILLNGGEFVFRSLRWEPDRLRLLTTDGVRDVAWNDLAELHLPRIDSWNSYFDQLATLNPQAKSRMMQLETSDGSRLTTSLERFRPRHWGNAGAAETWYQHLQPAWSLDPLWIRYRKVRIWRFWPPDVVPLMMIAPAHVERSSVFGGSWSWQLNRGVRGDVLQSAEWEFGGGFGVQASTELSFDYPPIARSIRTQAGLDRSAGTGGCVNLSVLDGASNRLFHVEHVIGSSAVHDTGWLTLPQDVAIPHRLVLRADMDHEQRPPGADPFDIRDAVNWYEPEIQLDRLLLPSELAQRAWKQLPGLAGWMISPEDASQIQVVNVLNLYDPRRSEYRLKFLAKDRPVTFTRKFKIEPRHRWLAAVLKRDHEQTTPASVQIRFNGHLLSDFDVPVQLGPLEPDPLLVPLEGYQGKTVTAELVILPHGEQSYIDWKGVSLSNHRPGALPVFEDQAEMAELLRAGEQPAVVLSADQPFSGTHALRVANGSAENGRLPGLDAWIAEQPRNGQYRYLVFAWRKAGGSRILLRLAHGGRFAEQLAPMLDPGERPAPQTASPFDPRHVLEDRGLRAGLAYEAGISSAPPNSPISLDTKLPDQWVLVARDLFTDFGPLNLTGLALGCPDGTAADFDHIYLARTPRDVEWLRTYLANPGQTGSAP